MYNALSSLLALLHQYFPFPGVMSTCSLWNAKGKLLLKPMMMPALVRQRQLIVHQPHVLTSVEMQLVCSETEGNFLQP